MNDVLLLLMFFGILAIGCLCGGRKRFYVPKSVAALFASLLIGFFGILLINFGNVLNAEQLCPPSWRTLP